MCSLFSNHSFCMGIRIYNCIIYVEIKSNLTSIVMDPTSCLLTRILLRHQSLTRIHLLFDPLFCIIKWTKSPRKSAKDGHLSCCKFQLWLACKDFNIDIRLMEEIPNNHLGCKKTSGNNEIVNHHPWWCRILSINSISNGFEHQNVKHLEFL